MALGADVSCEMTDESPFASAVPAPSVDLVLTGELELSLLIYLLVEQFLDRVDRGKEHPLTFDSLQRIN